jgi:large subunit ribosomal protein L21
VFAVVRTGGRQYRVQEGRTITVGRLPGEPGETVEVGDVLMIGEGDDVTVGTPLIDGARVLGTIAEQGRAKKVVVFRYKAKTRSRKKTGHRQHFTKVVVDDILAPGQEPKPKPAPEPEPAADEAAAEAAPKRRRRKKAEPAEEAEAAAPEADAEASAPEAAAEAEAPEAETDASAPDAQAEAEATDAQAAEDTTETAEAAPEEKPKRRSRRKAE